MNIRICRSFGNASLGCRFRKVNDLFCLILPRKALAGNLRAKRRDFWTRRTKYSLPRLASYVLPRNFAENTNLPPAEAWVLRLDHFVVATNRARGVLLQLVLKEMSGHLTKSVCSRGSALSSLMVFLDLKQVRTAKRTERY